MDTQTTLPVRKRKILKITVLRGVVTFSDGRGFIAKYVGSKNIFNSKN
jgi:hypothetical protein